MDHIIDHTYSVSHIKPVPNELCPAYMSPLDDVITDFMYQQQIPGASLALCLNGDLVYRQGYGIAGPGRVVTSKSLFRLASLSKPITAVAIMKLCEDGKLGLDSNVFGPRGVLQDFKPSGKGDKRIIKITVRHLLQHSAGWDRDQAGDPVFFNLQKVTKMLDPTCNEALVKYMMTKKLQFAPGKRHAYSNFGYLVLGMVLEKVTGMSYIDYVRSLIRCLDVEDVYVGYRKRILSNYTEVEYFNNREPILTTSVYPNEEGEVLPQYGGFKMEGTEAFGGLVASAVDLLTIFNNLSCKVHKHRLLDDLTFKKMIERPQYELGSEWYGLGLDIQDDGQTWGHTGAMEGTSTTYLHHKSGFSCVLLFNSWSKDMDIDGLVKFGLSCISKWPLYSHMTKMLDFKVNCDEMKIVSKNNYEVVQLFLPVEQFYKHVKEMCDLNYRSISVNLFIYYDSLHVNLIWRKNFNNIQLFYDFFSLDENKFTCEEFLKHHSVVLLDSCIWKEKPYFVVVYEKYSVNVKNKQIILLHERSGEYLDKKSQLKKDGYSVIIQSVAEHKNNLYVTAVFEKLVNDDREMVAWLQISTENFIYEMNKHACKNYELIYVKFYTVKDDPCVSAIWLSGRKSVLLQRHNVSIYGFLYELMQSMEVESVQVKSISCYYNDNILNFAAIWESDQCNKSYCESVY